MFTILDGRKDFFQWDLNQKLIVAEKVDRVHFEIGGKIEATEVKEENGVFVADVPNVILQIAGKLLVYAYIIGEGEEESITKIKECFGIKGRAKPPDYVYTETEVLSYEAIRKELADIEKRLKNVEENGGGTGTGGSGGYYIPTIREDGTIFWTATDSSMPPVDEAYIKGPMGEPGPQGPEGKQGPAGETGAIGPQGPKGEDGTSVTIKSISQSSESGGINRVTFSNGSVLSVKNGEAGEQGPQGPQGEQGKTGPQGPRGETGKGLTILGYYATLLQLEQNITAPEIGDIYGVGLTAPYNLYSWDGTTWIDNGQLQGAKGEKGDPGYSPIVVVSEIEGGHRVLIHHTLGSESFDVMDGKQGERGEKGDKGESGTIFKTDETLSLENGILSVNTATDVEADNTLPITSAAVAETVGNIEILLKTI